MIYILLSTYNGEEYLEEQLKSILSQKVNDHSFHVRVRDDGSSDKTDKILNKYAAIYDNFEISYGENKGPAASFMKLLEKVPDDAEYTFFCDQDDYWFENKLERAIDHLKERKSKLLYASAYYVADKELNLKYQSIKVQKPLKISNAVLQNPILGATFSINNNALKFIKQHLPDCNNIVMHDFWIYQVISIFGDVVFDKKPTMKYRLHEKNVLGTEKGFKKYLKFKRELIKFEENISLIIKQNKELIKVFGSMLSPKLKKDIVDLNEALKKERLHLLTKKIARRKIYHQRAVTDIFFLIKFWLSKKVLKDSL